MSILTRPRPLPEELDRGYLGRVMRINGYRTEADLFEAIAIHFGMLGRTRRELPTTQMAAMTAGLSTEQFVLLHTTLPIRRSITSYHPEVRHGSLERPSILVVSGMGTARRGWYFCLDCAKEDVGFHGVSYWRRDLQVPGQLWCFKHGTPLRYVVDEEAVSRTPMSVRGTSEVVATTIVRAAARNQCVVRYLKIADGLMERPQALPARTVGFQLKTRAAALGLRTHGGVSSSPLLSDLIVKSFPREWLATVCPSVLSKPNGEYLQSVDGVLFLNNSASAVWPYMLAAAVLYESADAALNTISDTTRWALQPGARQTAQIKDSVVIDAYVHARGNYSRAAKELSVSINIATAKFKKLGLPSMPPRSKSNLRVALSTLLLQRRSIDESAAAGNVTTKELMDVLMDCCPNVFAALAGMSEDKAQAPAKAKRARGLAPHEASSMVSAH